MSDLEWARVFAKAARELASVQASEDILSKIAELATGVASCPWAAIAKATDHTPAVAATNDPAIADQIAAIQATAGGGPTWDAMRRETIVYAADLTSEKRWPRHVKELLENTPVRSILAFCLKLEDQPLGVLTLYSDKPDAFAPPVFEAAQVYADHAAIALDRASSDRKAENLEIALQSSREIGIAIGILVERYKITTDQAFDMMRVASQHTHRKLRAVAADLVLTGEFEPGVGEALRAPLTPDAAGASGQLAHERLQRRQ